MTRQEAIDYIIQEAGPHGLVDECLEEFEHEAKDLTEDADYWPAANFALWEWDI